MDLDPRTSTILMECLLAHPISNRLAAGLLRALPVSLDSPRIKILVLVRRLNDFPLPFSSLEILSVLELLFKLAPAASIQIAYSAVALHLTARHRDEADFEDAASQIWGTRVECLKKSEELKGLVSKRLEEDGELVTKAVWYRAEREKLFLRDTRKEAEVAVRVCLEDVVKSLGPSAFDMAIASQNRGNTAGGSEKEGEERTAVEDILVGHSDNPSPHTVGDRKKCSAMNESASLEVGDRKKCRAMKKSASVEVRERVCTRSQSGKICKRVSNGRGRKRGKKYWSLEEVECLLKGVKKYGAGNWNEIRLRFLIFKKNSRSSTNLKDRWRNMIKKEPNLRNMIKKE